VTPEAARQLRGLLEGLGIDPNALEVRIGVPQPGEPGWLHGGGIIGHSVKQGRDLWTPQPEVVSGC
jgi:hypothetical protein